MVPAAGRDIKPSRCRSSALVRRRLLDRLAVLDMGGLGLVVAPTGFGKTTLLRQWSAHRGRVRWFGADGIPGPAHLRRELTLDVRGVVVDDAHLAASSAQLERLDSLVRFAAPRLPVVLSSRQLPALELARCGFPTPVIVNGADLAFRPAEVAALYAVVYDDPLPAEQAHALADGSEGWAAALQLWHVARRMSHVETMAGWTSLTPASRDQLPDCVRAHVDRAIVAGLPDAHAQLLHGTCVLEEVSADLADRLLGRADSHLVLADLARRTGMVTRQPDGRSYRVHRVLREHLRHVLVDTVGPAEAARAADRAADLLEEAASWREALKARCRAGNWSAAARLIAAHGIDGPSHDWLGLVPSAVIDATPALQLAAARRLLADGLADDARRLAATARQATDDARIAARCTVVMATADTWSSWFVAAATSPSALHLLARGLPGRAARALEETTSPDEDPGALAAALALAACTALSYPEAGAGDLDRVARETARRGLTWLRRIAYAVELIRTLDPSRWAQVHILAGQRRRLGDEWGAVLIETALAVASFRIGRPDLVLLEQLCVRFRGLGSSVLEAWARSALALAHADADLADLGGAASAEAFARSADAPGPLALAYAALARTEPDREAELMLLAESTATECELPVRPWDWLAGREPASPVSPGNGLPGPRHDDAAGMPALRPADPSPERTGEPGSPAGDSMTVRCFGAFSVESRGTAVDFGGVRPVAVTVLRLLAVNAGEPVHREVLLDALWPNLREAAALHNLHVAISSLRGVLDSVAVGASRSLLARQGKSYLLGPGTPLLTDVQRFDALAGHATACRRAGDPTAEERALVDAVAWYRGAILPEDGPAEWVVDVRDRYRVAAAEAAGRLAEVLLARGRLASAVAAVSRSLHIDPLRDGSWRTLIAAHEQAGQPAEAARARRRYAAVLDSLGVTSAALDRAAGDTTGRPASSPDRGGGQLTDRAPVMTA